MTRPSLKSTIPHFHADGAVHFRMAGELLTLDDADGRVGCLLKLMDGTRETDDVFTELAQVHPETTRAEFDEAIAELDASRLLQDAAADPGVLTETQRERWSRNIGFFETVASLTTSKYEFQRRIRDTKVAMLGVGGVGSHVLMDMVALGFMDIRIVDFDTVELSNLNRQVLYGDHALGRSKVELAAEWARRFHRDVRVETVDRMLSSADEVYAAVHDRDIVVGAIDRPKTRGMAWLNEGCVRAGAALITGGVETQRTLHYTIVPGVSGCIQCWQSAALADPMTRRIFDLDREIEDAGQRSGEDVAALSSLVTLQTAFLVNELVRLATGSAPPLAVGRLLQALFHNPVLRAAETWRRDPDCAVCGGVEPAERFRWLVDQEAPSLEPSGVWTA
jgi:molybdopterin/thiamine biosynthesis adenylyltransferase